MPFYAAPDAAASPKGPVGSGAHARARLPCADLNRPFPSGGARRCRQDGHTRGGCGGIDGTHLMEVVAIGRTRRIRPGWRTPSGASWSPALRTELGAVEAHEIAPAAVPAAPAGPIAP